MAKVNLLDKICEMQELNAELASEGYALQLVKLNPTASTTTKKNGSAKQGYWKKVKRLVERDGMTFKQARRAVTKGKVSISPAKPSRRMPPAAKKKLSLSRKKYWRDIHKIEADKGVSIQEAKRLYAEAKK